MGLDMYIERVNRTDHSVEELRELDASLWELDREWSDTPDEKLPEEFKEFLPLSRPYGGIFHEAAYWRKANQIHNWFVNNVQDGVDECQLSELTKDNLEDLLETIKKALETKDSSLLPPVGGFFFGSTAVDDWYWGDLERTVKTLEDVFSQDWEKYRFFYRASW